MKQYWQSFTNHVTNVSINRNILFRCWSRLCFLFANLRTELSHSLTNSWYYLSSHWLLLLKKKWKKYVFFFFFSFFLKWLLCLWSRMSDSLILVLLSFCLAVAVKIMFCLKRIWTLSQWSSLLTPKYGENTVNIFVLMIILFANFVWMLYIVYKKVYWVMFLRVFFFCRCICCIVMSRVKGMGWCTFFVYNLQVQFAVWRQPRVPVKKEKWKYCSNVCPS